MSSSFADINQKISSSSSLSKESKEIFGMIVMLLQSSHLETDRKLANFETKMNETMNYVEEMKADFKSCFDGLRNDVRSGFEERDTKIVSIMKEVDALKKEVCDQRLAAVEQDAYTRRDSLIFSGDSIPAVTSGEDCTQIVRKIVREQLKMNIDPLMSTAHRLGKPPSGASNKPDKRDIIVRFCQRDDKFRIHEATRKAKINGLYANESLTPTRRRIHLALLDMKRKHRDLVRGTMTHNGKIFVFTKPAPNASPTARSIRTEINSMERLSSFCAGFIKQPLENYLKTMN